MTSASAIPDNRQSLRVKPRWLTGSGMDSKTLPAMDRSCGMERCRRKRILDMVLLDNCIVVVCHFVWNLQFGQKCFNGDYEKQFLTTS
ncbi:MAG: hypothetical protein F4073_02885 [Rhodobacteraceae bacterium]|nr:hypothetical protein [Paracoccaceae bacterium]MYF45392.1 hypothetical protein [Paracoccaceae bacterium]MYI90882.1 hypothetical protein [Paracoccaceae bacterium]